jgi:acyl-CoA reductase-like NAD-dependent aldehyde dehydrogenase/nicotinamidase-related amidase
MTSGSGATAIVLVDLQHDFLDRPGLVPDLAVLDRGVTRLLDAGRACALPIAHVHTLTRPDGSDRMPHWKAQGTVACVAGTRGAETPDAFAPAPGELVATKQYFSGFSDPELDRWLRERGATHLIVAGVYTHGCVRETVLDAYELGYTVSVAEDAVGTTDPVHGAVTRSWLDGRAARFRTVAALSDELGIRHPSARPDAPRHPVALIGGVTLPGTTQRRYVHRAPARTDAVLAEVPLGGRAEVEAAVAAATASQPAWARTRVTERGALLDRWADTLASAAADLVTRIVDEVGKPRGAAEDEIQRAVGHVRTAAALLERFGEQAGVARGVTVRYRPVGVVGLVMPWNNPVALPVGKIAPAIAFGNSVVLKPAPEASGVALALADSLSEAGAPPGVVNIVLGDREAAEGLCDAAAVDAISVTGSIATGRSIAARCGRSEKALQAELGGNNAAIVFGDADLDRVVLPLLRNAYAFAGQRCTAIRRFVVDAAIAGRFETAAAEAIAQITVGEPDQPGTEAGPMISVEARERVLGAVHRAQADGARVVAGGQVPAGFEHGAWLAPTLLADVDPGTAIAQEETFGPVAVIIPVSGADEAIAVANGVEQGLVMAVCTGDDTTRRRVFDEARVGIVQVGPGPLAVHPDAPFGGWKASGIGPPEHGEWDAAFYTRPQAVYGDD